MLDLRIKKIKINGATYKVAQKWSIYYTYRRLRQNGITSSTAKHLICMTLIGAGS